MQLNRKYPRPVTRGEERITTQARKRRHTVKTQVMVNQGRLILHNTRHVKESKHDPQLLGSNTRKTPPNAEAGLDLDY